jgi:exoribonuclease R
MSPLDLEHAILAHVNSPGYQPVKPRVIAAALGLSLDLGRDVKRAIKVLVKRGRLVYGSNHLVGLPRHIESDGVVGVFRRMAAGYGFVRPTAKSAGRGVREDIYISAKSAGDASTGDTVLVRLVVASRGGRQALQASGVGRRSGRQGRTARR